MQFIEEEPHKETLSLARVRGRAVLIHPLKHKQTHKHTCPPRCRSLSVCFAHRLHCSLFFLISDSRTTLHFVGTFTFVDVVTGVHVCVECVRRLCCIYVMLGLLKLGPRLEGVCRYSTSSFWGTNSSTSVPYEFEADTFTGLKTCAHPSHSIHNQNFEKSLFRLATHVDVILWSVNCILTSAILFLVFLQPDVGPGGVGRTKGSSTVYMRLDLHASIERYQLSIPLHPRSNLYSAFAFTTFLQTSGVAHCW